MIPSGQMLLDLVETGVKSIQIKQVNARRVVVDQVLVECCLDHRRQLIGAFYTRCQCSGEIRLLTSVSRHFSVSVILFCLFRKLYILTLAGFITLKNER